jgi:hypothetical protein
VTGIVDIMRLRLGGQRPVSDGGVAAL